MTLKRETESLICAVQEQAIRTDLINRKIGKLRKQPKCRICSSRAAETTNHIARECPKPAPKEHKRRHE